MVDPEGQTSNHTNLEPRNNPFELTDVLPLAVKLERARALREIMVGPPGLEPGTNGL